jgi:hypothetical protein
MRSATAISAILLILASNTPGFAECGCACINNTMKPFCDAPSRHTPNCGDRTCQPADANGNPLPANAIFPDKRYVCKSRPVQDPSGWFKFKMVCL